jgi:endonuclease VIII
MWGVYPPGRRWPRGRHRAWLVIRTPKAEVVQFDGPVLELMTESRARFDQRIAGLGPDVLADEFDSRRYLRRLREDDQTRPIGDTLLEQRNLAGLGTIWRTEGLFAAAIDPWRPTGEVSDDAALAVVEAVRPRMARSARQGFDRRDITIYGRGGRPCPRCGALVRSGNQGDNNRRLFWCPGCQR